VSSLVKVKEKLVPSRLTQIRSQIDIMASILNEAVKGVNKTRIMYRCNLSYRQLQRYLKLLSGLELLSLVSRKRSGKTVCFKTSAKGCAFLDAYRRLRALMG
jgi:predicted transcriptional regulator